MNRKRIKRRARDFKISFIKKAVTAIILILMANFIFYTVADDALEEGYLLMTGAILSDVRYQSSQENTDDHHTAISSFLNDDNQQILIESGTAFFLQNGYGNTGASFLHEKMKIKFYLTILFVFCTAIILLMILGYFLDGLELKKDKDLLLRSWEKERMATGVYKKETDISESIAANEMPEFSSLLIFQIRDSARKMQEFYAHQLDICVQEKEKIFEFSQNIYHQQKTSLAGLSIILEQIWMNDAENEKIRTCLKLCSQLSTQATTLLNIGKFEANMIHISKTKHDLSIVIEEAIEKVAILIEQKELTLIEEMPSDCMLNLNDFWMTEAIENILVNICEHSKSGGRILIKLGHQQNGYLITIEDHAGGMMVDNPFERYAGAEGTNHFGIGLHLSRAIIQSHFGTIDTQNYESGTRFLIFLPVLSGKAPYVTSI